MTDKKLIEIANMELRDQLEAEKVRVKNLKALLKEFRDKIRYSAPTGVATFADIDDVLLSKMNKVLAEE